MIDVSLWGNNIDDASFLIIDFVKGTSSVCSVRIIHHCIVQFNNSTRYIKATVPSIRYFINC